MATEAIVPRKTGQWFDSHDGGRWWFDSSSLALDFTYTGAMARGTTNRTDTDDETTATERLRTPEALTEWLVDRFPGLGAKCTERELADARLLRDAIARLAASFSGEATTHADDIDAVNLFAATPDIPPVLTGGGRQAGRTQARTTQAMSTIARDAVRLFGPDAGGRIRSCAAPDCNIIYLDTSRGGSRRWCSMSRCGNRAKVRAHRARANSKLTRN